LAASSKVREETRARSFQVYADGLRALSSPDLRKEYRVLKEFPDLKPLLDAESDRRKARAATA